MVHINRLPDFISDFLLLVFSVRCCCQFTPHRRWPGGVRFVTNDMVQVQLRNEISKRGNVDFVGIEHIRDSAGESGRFSDELVLVCHSELVYLCDIWAIRYKHEPGIIAVIHQQQVT